MSGDDDKPRSAVMLALTRRRIAEMIGLVIFLCFVLFSQISSPTASSSSSAIRTADGASKYLYNSIDSPPVIEHGLGSADYTKSTSPKVVEFYDPKCGACQAFKSNFIEVAKKVQSNRPNVEFYAVSCQVHHSLCAQYGSSVPKIIVFNAAENDGTEVQKGSGAVYFLSQRLLKALRAPNEVAADGLNAAVPDRLRRRLGVENDDEYAYGDGDVGESSAQNKPPSEKEGDDYETGEMEEIQPERELPRVDIAHSNEDAIIIRRHEEEDSLQEESLQEDTVEVTEEGSADETEDAIMIQMHEDDEESPQSNVDVGGAGADVDMDADNRDGRVKKNEDLHEPSAKVEPSAKRVNSNQARQRSPVFESQQTSKGVQSKPFKQAGPAETSRENNNDDIESDNSIQRPPENIESNQDEQENNELHRPAVVPRENWKPLHETDAWKNTLREAENSKTEMGKHFRKWKEEHEKKMLAQEKREAGERQTVIVEKPIPFAVTCKDDPSFLYGGKAGYNCESIRGNKGICSKKVDGLKIGVMSCPEACRMVHECQYALQDKGGEKSTERVKTATVEHPDFPPRLDNSSNNQQPQQHLPKQSNIPPPRQTIPVAGKDMTDEQIIEFQKFVAKQRQSIARQNKLKHPIKTIIGGNDEAKQQQQKVTKQKNQSPMNNYKSQYRPAVADPKDANKNKNAADLRPEAQKKGVGEQLFAKVPIVKRAFKRSHAEETLNDAALSFTRGLMMGVLRTSDDPLDYKRKAALMDWLDLLSISLPPELNLHELIDTLRLNIDSISQSPKSLTAIIEKHHIPNPNWSDSCTKKVGLGFFCGFWKLLHIMSMGVSEQAGGLALQESYPTIRIFSAKEAGDVIREYMAYFFNCEKCTQRFIAQYDDCSFQRCNRLSDATVDAPADSWKEFSIWLWEVHNDVSRSKASRASDVFTKWGKKEEAKRWERDMSAVYPHIDQCLTCFTAEGLWDVNAVYLHLEREYW